MAKENQTSKLDTARKKEYAKILFLNHDYTQKEIAEKVGTGPHTIGRWVKEGNWETMRRSLVMTKGEILNSLYQVMETLTISIKESGGGDVKDADRLIKISSAIKNLETDTSITEMMETAKLFVRWLQTMDMDFAARVMEHFDMYFKERLKRH